MPSDLYAILGLSRDASPEDIKKAYRRMSKEWHPDKHKGEKDAETKFKEINQAYEVLSNPEKKRMYDQFGSTGGPGAGGSGFNGAGGFDFSGFQNGEFGDLGDMFQSFFGGARARQATKGEDHEIELEISLPEVLSGVAHTVNLRRQTTCDICSGNGAKPGTTIVQCATCGGTGQVTRMTQSLFGRIQQRAVCPDCHGKGTVPKEPCHTCRGEGRIESTSSVTITVPPGIESGQTLRLRGQGDAGRRGEEGGDLFVHIRVRRDPHFERDGADIRTHLSIPVIDAILGSTLEVPTIQGASTVQIPTGMQPGQVFRLRGKGLPVLSSSRFGDHYVKVDVDIPKKLSREEKKLLEQWKDMRG